MKHPTNDQVRKALQGSIAKWTAIAKLEDVDRGAENCPLCKLFYKGRGSCNGCPVKVETGKDVCYGSPYYEYKYADLWGMSVGKQVAAERETRFLQSLDKKFFVIGVDPR